MRLETPNVPFVYVSASQVLLLCVVAVSQLLVRMYSLCYPGRLWRRRRRSLTMTTFCREMKKQKKSGGAQPPSQTEYPRVEKARNPPTRPAEKQTEKQPKPVSVLV